MPTRDGRRCGNAHIIGIHRVTNSMKGYVLLTDAGNVLEFLEQEIHEYFYPPTWVADVDEIKRRFQK
jgi:hypothetical protein